MCKKGRLSKQKCLHVYLLQTSNTLQTLQCPQPFALKPANEPLALTPQPLLAFLRIPIDPFLYRQFLLRARQRAAA